ncbi:polysaccharide biosynthesis/export family protein [Thalassobius sp. S69A]|uniref:polysaccharide biosynthesis/export family protein n=1 Tax=unclassified Thalassovita TaxID=2619711 RepID=UPI000C393D54|nr:polysaccharide biosynthesis protein [Paracoccaceae bacterium]
MTSFPKANAFLGLGLVFLGGCSVSPMPDNIEQVSRGGGYQAQYREPPSAIAKPVFLESATMNAQRCKPLLGGGFTDMAQGGKGGKLAALPLLGERVTRNDLVDVRVDDDEVLNGSYVISRDGTLKLPFLDPIRAQGRTTDDIEADLGRALLAEGFYETLPRLSVRVTDFASVSVGVNGAVFEPHAVEIGGVPGDQIDSERQTALGSSTEARNLSAAIRAAGGLRPDADLSAVELRRANRTYRLDLRDLFAGRTNADVMLLTGDEIFVHSRDCFQDDLMKPGPLSPPGVTLFLSNLTQPALHNASSAIGREVREVPYGTRYIQAVVDSNCVGGAQVTSARRSALLASRNPMTGVSTVIERKIEPLLRRADRDDYDPYVLPGDALACYDSSVTNLAEAARVLGLIGALTLFNKSSGSD